ncbi:tyrosine-type recombinase/integrase [Lacipirellula sp.]|uniref:tyrosine-type recombinase/integrase n=1 Tax=Lacipirellula sp. TaxID=2691419 RepID=UPI003D14A1A7
MASLEKRGSAYRIVFRYAGIKYARSLETKSEKTAQAALARLEDNLHRLQLGTLQAPEHGDLAGFLLADVRRNATAFSASVPPQTPTASGLTLACLFERFWANLPEGSLEKSTIAGMKIHQRQLEKHFGKTLFIQSLTLSQLQGYIQERSKDKGLHGHRVKSTTIKKAIVTLRTVWNWGRQHELIEKEFPSRGLKYPKGEEKLPFMTFAEVQKRVLNASVAEAAELWECAFLSTREINELLERVKAFGKQPAVHPMFMFAAHTGARRSEMIRSKLTDIDFVENVITIHERKRSHDKVTTRRVPMSPPLRDAMKSLVSSHPGTGSTFWHQASATRGHRMVAPQPLDADTAHDYFKQTLSDTKWNKLRGWHVFRHSFCSNAAAAGIDQRIINSWVGHQTEEMVQRYRHMLPNHEQAAIALVFSASS